MKHESQPLKSVGSYQRLLVIVALAAALTLPWLTRPFHTRGEPREALVAQAMLSTGNWISPPAYDQAVPSKPPFSHWLIALASLPEGEVTETTARLPSALAVILFSAAFFIFLEARVSLGIATSTALVLLASSEWFRSASTCRVDTLLATSMAGGLLSLFCWWERSYRGIPWLAIFLIGSAALTKGPVGVVLPLGVFGLFCWARAAFGYRALTGIVLRSMIIGVPVVAIASVWYVLGYLERVDAFVDKIRYENLERFTSSMADEPHKHSSGYLLGMLALGIMPWSLCFLAGCSLTRLRNGRRQSDSGIKRRFFGLGSWWIKQEPFYQFSWIVALGIVLFFCVPSGKRSVYLLPAYPFIAFLLEHELRRFADERGSIFIWIERTIILFLILLAVAMLVLLCTPVGGVGLKLGALGASMTTTKVLSAGAIVALLGVVLRETLRELWAERCAKLAIIVVAAVALISFFSYDGIAWQMSPKSWVYGEQLQRALKVQPPPRLFSYGSEAYGASFYLKRKFSRATPGGVTEGSLVFLEERKRAEFESRIADQVEEVARYSSGLESRKHDVVVLRVIGAHHDDAKVSTEN